MKKELNEGCQQKQGGLHLEVSILTLCLSKDV